MDHPRPWLKYVDAKDLDEQANLRNLDVLGTDGETLGTVDGFIIDEASARPYYVVVGAGGWFTHKHFLVPIGHVSANGSALAADLTKARAKRFPGFDKSEFEKLSSDDLTRMNDELAAPWDAGDHYTAPAWWKDSYYRPAVGDRH